MDRPLVSAGLCPAKPYDRARTCRCAHGRASVSMPVKVRAYPCMPMAVCAQAVPPPSRRFRDLRDLVGAGFAGTGNAGSGYLLGMIGWRFTGPVAGLVETNVRIFGAWQLYGDLQKRMRSRLNLWGFAQAYRDCGSRGSV